MANADPDRDFSEDEDEEVAMNHQATAPVEENHVQPSPGSSKQNGNAMSHVDRYGFIGGSQYTDPDDERRLPPEILRKRELKWLDMFDDWEKWMSKRFKKIKERCRKGIPPSLRSRAWQYLCGSRFLMENNKGRFENYLQQSGDPKWMDDIQKDLHRQFPLHEIAHLGWGQEDLFKILKAYTIHNPKDGYCQAQAPIAAVLLMHMPAEQAFWCLVSICEKYLPGYFSPGLEAVQVDGDVLFGLVKKTSPAIYKHLKKQDVIPILYMTEWFMCVFTRTLPWSSVLRVWDVFFCEGVKVLFRVALVLIRISLGEPGTLSKCPSLYETLEALRRLPLHQLEEEGLIQETLRLNISERDMEKEHQKQIQRRRAKDKSKDSGRSKSKSRKTKT
ncbi:TBC1 domain family member 10A-like [Argopecten irradians]|uniref:TBC1 domain family member 10A-like n=1 Tax=Argopecten irradians TaxID=31199 RepID=UPI003716389E